MSNVMAYVRSRSGHRRARSSLDGSVTHVYDGKYTRARAATLRQRALAEEEDELVVSSPKDKNFCSVPWDTLKDRKSEEFSPTATPVSEGPRTPTSAEYAHFHDRPAFERPRLTLPFTQPKGHRRASSTPDANSEAVLSAGRKPALLLKRRPMPVSKSEPTPQARPFPTINELNDTPSYMTTQKPLPQDPNLAHSRPRPDSATIPVYRNPPRSIDVLEQHSLLLQQQAQQQQGTPPPTQQRPTPTPPQTQPQNKPSLPISSTPKSRPTHIDLPPPPPSSRLLNLPSELHVHTPEYTDALKQWFPAMANAPVRKDRRGQYGAGAVGVGVGVG